MKTTEKMIEEASAELNGAFRRDREQPPLILLLNKRWEEIKLLLERKAFYESILKDEQRELKKKELKDGTKGTGTKNNRPKEKNPEEKAKGAISAPL